MPNDPKTDDMKKIGKVIKRHREDLGMIQNDLAQHLHCSISAISTYETGKKMIPFDKLNSQAELFGVSIGQLLYPDEYTPEEIELIRDFQDLVKEAKTLYKSEYYDAIKGLIALAKKRKSS